MSWSDRPDDPLPPGHPERDHGRLNNLVSVLAVTHTLIRSVIVAGWPGRRVYTEPDGDGSRS